MTEYPAITVWQPWASLIAIGAKPFEYRSTPPPEKYIGQRIAIHAAARDMRRAEVAHLLDILGTDKGAAARLKVSPALDLLERVWRSFGVSGPPVLPYGAVVCLVTLGSPTRADALSKWAWPLTDIEPIDGPHPYVRGHQSWFYWQDHRG